MPQSVKTRNISAGFIANRIWRFFSSLKFALILMLVLVGLSLIGTFVIQVPSTYLQNSVMYSSWLENVAQPETGFWFIPLRSLGFFDMFHSIWFLGAGALLAASIVICSLNRWRQIKASIVQERQATGVKRSLNDSDNAIMTIPGNLTNNRSRILKIFQKNRYSTKEIESDGIIYLTADKNRFSPLGTYLIHLSLVLFIVGFLVGSYLGFRDPSFMVAEGETKNVGNGTVLALGLESFTDEYWDNGSPKNYTSQVTIYDNGQKAEQGAVQVNHPLVYKGVSFNQSFFGSTAKVNVRDSLGNVLFDGNILLTQTYSQHPYIRPVGYVQPPQSGLTVYAVGRATNIQDGDLADNQIGIEVYQGEATVPIINTKIDKGIPLNSDQFQVTYIGDGNYSGFQISRDPGKNIIWIASGMFLSGLVAVFYFPRRQILAALKPCSATTSNLYLRSGIGRKIGVALDLDKLAEEIKNALKSEKIQRKETKR